METNWRKDIDGYFVGRCVAVPKKIEPHEHNYEDQWMNITGDLIFWKDIDDSYLLNIRRKIQRCGFGDKEVFPYRAFFFCIKEMNRRGMPTSIELGQSDYQKVHDELYKLDYKNTQELQMYPKHELLKQDNSIVPPKVVTNEELLNYFMKKVKLLNGKTGIVISIHANNANCPYGKLQVMDESGSLTTVNAGAVEIVKQIAVYAYQHKNGEITWTTTSYAPSVLKKRGLKKIESATKYFDA